MRPLRRSAEVLKLVVEFLVLLFSEDDFVNMIGFISSFSLDYVLDSTVLKRK